jgi:hypothetical protein
MIYEITLGMLFGVVLGAGSAFAYLVISSGQDNRNHTKATKDLARILKQLSRGSDGEVTIKKVKKADETLGTTKRNRTQDH